MRIIEFIKRLFHREKTIEIKQKKDLNSPKKIKQKKDLNPPKKMKQTYVINVNLKMYSFDHLRMYNIDHINTCCSRW